MLGEPGGAEGPIRDPVRDGFVRTALSKAARHMISAASDPAAEMMPQTPMHTQRDKNFLIAAFIPKPRGKAHFWGAGQWLKIFRPDDWKRRLRSIM